jgi:hypothetical protein
MRYLVATRPERVAVDTKDDWAEEGEPVIPWYPAPADNVFLGLDSFKKAPYAVVVDVKLDPDELVERLVKQYPGLPEILHENYVFAIGLAAHRFPIGTKFQVYVDTGTAKLKVVGREEYHLLWTKQPLKTLENTDESSA